MPLAADMYLLYHHYHQLFPSSYGVTVFDKPPPFPSFCIFFTRYCFFAEISLQAISQSPFWSTPPPSAFHFHMHNPSHYTVLFLSHNMPIPLESPFLGFLGCFGHLSSPSDSFIPCFIHPCDSTHPSQHSHLCHIKLLSLSLVNWPCFCPVHHGRPLQFSQSGCTLLFSSQHSTGRHKQIMNLRLQLMYICSVIYLKPFL